MDSDEIREDEEIDLDKAPLIDDEELEDGVVVPLSSVAKELGEIDEEEEEEVDEDEDEVETLDTEFE